jgi:EamA domain-containing membrane protein RarD
LIGIINYKKLENMDRNTTEVAIAQFTALGVSLSDVEESLQITSLVLAVTFGIYKWVAEIIKIKNKRKGRRK